MTDEKDAFLDDMFDTVRSDDPVPSDALRARVIADAVASQVGDQVPLTGNGFWSSFASLLGGWPALGGVAAAGVTGLWLGLMPPAVVETLAADVLGNTTSVSFFSDLDDFVEGSAIDG